MSLQCEFVFILSTYSYGHLIFSVYPALGNFDVNLVIKDELVHPLSSPKSQWTRNFCHTHYYHKQRSHKNVDSQGIK